MNEEITLGQLKIGESAEIVGYHPGDLRYKIKLLSLGLVRGARITLLRTAPLGDPAEISVLSYRLSLRRSEAAVLRLRRL